MSIIQKFLTNQIAANEIIIVMMPYCPTPQNLLHIEKGMNLLSLKTFGESKCPGCLNFLWNYSQTHYRGMRWWTSKWTLGHRRKKRGEGGITPGLPFHYPILFTTKLTRKLHFKTISVVFSLSNKLDEEYIETKCSSNVITLYI